MGRNVWACAVIMLATLPCATNVAQGKPTRDEVKSAAKAPVSDAKKADKSVLLYKAQVKRSAHYKSEGSLSIEAGGQKVTIDLKQVENQTITEVAANGNITRESKTELSEVTFNGMKSPEEDLSKRTETYTITPTGTLVSYKTVDPDSAKTQARISVSNTIVFPATPIGVGDKWVHEYKADNDLGTHDAHADFEVLSADKVAGVDTLKIKMTFKEAGADTPLGTTGTYVVEKISGDTISADIEIENLKLGGDMGPAASGKIHVERTDGSLYDPTAKPGDTKATDKPADTKTPPAKPGDAKTGDGKTPPAKPADTKTEVKPEVKKEKTIDDTVKDYEKLPGLFTLYRKKESGRETIYAEVKEDQLDKLMLLEATASTGTSSQIVAGTPINDILFKFVKSEDDKLLMVTPNISFRAKDGTPIARAIKRSFADAYLESFKIEAKQPDRKSLLINISELFRGDIAQVSQLLSGGGGGMSALFGGGGGSYGMDREKTYIASIKSFPENIVVDTQYHFVGRGSDPALADGRSIPFRVNYTLFALPDNGYRPRLADPRVGYFLTDYQSYDNDSLDDTMVRYIYRWDMQKLNAELPMSQPKKQIVFWLDNAIPLEYRDTVREALLMWNKAFEKVGIRDAIAVKQMPDNADWDHADMRYNTIRWVTSPQSGYAVALFRVNPVTGQIVNANITVDANFTRFIKMERAHLVDPASYFDDPLAITANGTATGAANGGLNSTLKLDDPRRCEMGPGMMEQAWFGNLALNLMRPEMTGVDEQAYMRSYLREVVAHEMGHIMGLRHNFIASTYHNSLELSDAKTVQETGTTASMMDYTPFNIYALKKKGVDFYSPTLGAYDYWAIQYGYTPIDAKTPTGELYKLSDIASRCNQPGLAYESDEAADSFDPAIVRFDLGHDPLAYYTKEMQVTRELLLHLPEREPKKGESYYRFTQDFNRLIGMYARAAAQTSRYIGGLHLNRNHRGDPGEKPVLAPVDGAEQKQALQLINTYILSEDAFSLPKSYFGKLTSDPFGGLDIAAILNGGGSDFPMRDQFASIQKAALNRLFDARVMKRVINNEYKAADPAKAFSLPYLYNSVGNTVWSELASKKNITPLHRQLQHAYIDTLITMVINPSNGAPDDAKLLAWDQLTQLRAKIAAAKNPAYDDYTRIHLAESTMRIGRALDAKQVISTGGASAGPSLLQMLLGGEGTSPNTPQPRK